VRSWDRPAIDSSEANLRSETRLFGIARKAQPGARLFCNMALTRLLMSSGKYDLICASGASFAYSARKISCTLTMAVLVSRASSSIARCSCTRICEFEVSITHGQVVHDLVDAGRPPGGTCRQFTFGPTVHDPRQYHIGAPHLD
jgi:hypothetical protein